MCRRLSDTFVIDADSRCVGVAYDITVKNNDRYSAPIDFLDHRSKSCRLVRRYYYNIEFIVGKIPYVLNLLFIAVICRPYFNRRFLMEHNLPLDFIVHLHAPVVLATLRDSDPVGLFLGAATYGQQDDNRNDICGSSVHCFHRVFFKVVRIFHLSSSQS